MILASQLQAEDAVIRDIVDAGDYYLKVIKKGQTVRILDIEGNQAADTLFYNANDISERYSAIDTIREQGNVYLTAGSVLMTNDCNPLLKIVADTCGRHDTLGGPVRPKVIPCVTL
ncbi:urea carboxylase-associated family protein [Paraglaciecola aquimarina]|uniref:Urea carboxylase-associated family protein n=1 Tax=Paraglaciecola aquimarina TaxID=1235557 RepID=A0ABU3SVD9_9ALTE|nr:urea carboxylase-associated family protein [Paraglaciecola aquimarina]MDU0353951.1 urea carboxylase-associated family protein [Paraglaciecola aquimarina]